VASVGASRGGEARPEECGARTGGRGHTPHARTTAYGAARAGALWSAATTSRRDTRLHMAVYPGLTAFMSKFLN
jgi:hypothetical protein